MQNITPTIYGSRLQAMLLSKLPFATEQNTTLNELFSILAGVQPSSGVYPATQYYCIGNKGHKNATGTGGHALNETVQHLATHAGLYEHLPFVLRATNNDISNSEQQKYALRKTVTIGGDQYYAYYLKRLPTDQVEVTTTINTTVDGETTSVGYTPSLSDLTPTPPVLDPESVNLLSGQYALVSAPMPMVLTAGEITEILNAAEIIYGSSSYATVSEIGLVSGVDYEITLPNNNTMNEVICAQIVAFISAVYHLPFISGGLNGSINVGTNEPLLVLQEA